MIKRKLHIFKNRINGLFAGASTTDDFDWDKYHTHYKGELSDISKEHTQVLNTGDYEFKENELLIKREIAPLHPNHRLLYETIIQLSPSTLMELGCGACDHLHNISVLAPDINLYGRELSYEQIKLARKRHPELKAGIMQLDITMPQPVNSIKVDIAFTQAVIMHLHTGNSHLVALSNIFRYAAKQVVLMENWTQHDFMGDIEFLFSEKMLPWKELYFYYRESIELKRPHLMVISSTPIESYKPLSDYSILKDAVK